MPSLNDHKSTKLVKLLLMGNSGVGKTGALATLAQAGYRLFVFDFDNGLDILLDPKILPPQYRDNVFYKSLQDKPTKVGSSLVLQATAWADLMKSLGDWKEGTTSLGGFTTWGEKDVIVIDSLTIASDRAMDEALKMGGRLGQRPQIQDYSSAMDSIQSLLELLYGDTCQCNVVMTAHLMYLEDGTTGGIKKGFPNVIGQKLAPKIPRYFNNMVLLQKKVVGNTVHREIFTEGTFNMDLKVSKPSVIPAKVEPDLGKLFALLKGESATPAVSGASSNQKA